MRFLSAPLLLLAALTVATPALARDHDDNRYDNNRYAGRSDNNYRNDRHDNRGDRHDDRGGWHDSRRDARDDWNYRPDHFRPHDRDLIVNWYAYGGYRPAPYRVIYLPPVVYTQLRPIYGPRFRPYEVPADLSIQLGPVPYGFQRVIIGRDILIVHLGTGRVVDRITW